MKKTITIPLLTLAALFLCPLDVFAACTYQAHIRSNATVPVEIFHVNYKYVDDFFGDWDGLSSKSQKLTNSTDTYTTDNITNSTLACGEQGYAISVDYWCYKPDGKYTYSNETSRLEGGQDNDAYITIDECDIIFAAEDTWPETEFDGYVAGYIYGHNSDANNKCMQAQTDSFANYTDVHLWDQCVTGDPQKNRQWKYEVATGYIRNVADPTFCLATNGPNLRDNIHMWKCGTGTVENMIWDYNSLGLNLIRWKENPFMCIFRTGNSVGEPIQLWGCTNGEDQNGRWNITWGESG